LKEPALLLPASEQPCHLCRLPPAQIELGQVVERLPDHSTVKAHLTPPIQRDANIERPQLFPRAPMGSRYLFGNYLAVLDQSHQPHRSIESLIRSAGEIRRAHTQPPLGDHKTLGGNRNEVILASEILMPASARTSRRSTAR
jgi:hypothetical protein